MNMPKTGFTPPARAEGAPEEGEIFPGMEDPTSGMTAPPPEDFAPTDGLEPPPEDDIF